MEVISMESSVYQDLVDRLNRIEQYVERTTQLLRDIQRLYEVLSGHLEFIVNILE